tara:strand:- start:4607 stop:5536 length:930 start_codon:yes stop_codon:yes gene_type:complete
MSEITHVETIGELNAFFHQEKPKHPLISIIDFSKTPAYEGESLKVTTGFYSVMLKNHCFGRFTYGRSHFDFEEGALMCSAPHQVGTVEPELDKEKALTGWGLFFHPDLLLRTSLSGKMDNYTFFDYDMNEALHLSDKEKQTLNDCIKNIGDELDQNIDKHSQTLLVSNIELLLNYCTRFYDRQFITRSTTNKDILIRFEQVLKDYFQHENLRSTGLPTVKYCAEKLALSGNYLSDLLKKETGKNAQEHIHNYLIEQAKTALLGTSAPVSEIAYDLGFEYPQYFSKLFKAKTGMTPALYRNEKNGFISEN